MTVEGSASNMALSSKQAGGKERIPRIPGTHN